MTVVETMEWAAWGMCVLIWVERSLRALRVSGPESFSKMPVGGGQ